MSTSKGLLQICILLPNSVLHYKFLSLLVVFLIHHTKSSPVNWGFFEIQTDLANMPNSVKIKNPLNKSKFKF